MKRLLYCFLALMILGVCHSAAAPAEAMPTAVELFEQDPDPDVPMACDPMMDPLIVLVNQFSASASPSQ